MSFAPAGLSQDLRSGLRFLRGDPYVALVAIFTLGLGIAVTTTVFGWVDNVLLLPIPGAASAGRLVALEEVPSTGQTRACAYPDFRDFQKGANLLSGLAAWHLLDFTIGAGPDAQRVYGQVVSANFFSVLGVNAVSGRTFTIPEDRDEPAGYPYAVISERLWRSRFGADPGILGAAVRINGRAITIVGVAPAEFQGTVTGLRLDLWVHLSMIHEVGGAGDWPVSDRNAKPLALIGRLRPGTTLAQANAQVQAVARRIAEEYPATHAGASAVLLPLWRSHGGAQATLLAPLSILLAFSVLVLLIACANVANLLLAQAVSRQSEFGMRRAMGAGRWRLLRQALVESAILTIPAVAAGLLLTLWLGSALSLLLPPTDLPLAGFVSAELNGRLLAFASAACAFTAFLSGIAPALYASRADFTVTLRAGSRGATAASRPHRARTLLVVTEVALASVALIAAGVFLRSFRNASAVRLGFDPENVLVARLYLASAGYSAAREQMFCRALRQRLENEPAIEAASYAIEVPLAQTGDETIKVEGYLPRQGESLVIPRNNVGPDYFRLLRIPLIAGREFTERDDRRAPPVAIVNETFARRFFPGADPIGRRLRVALDESWFTIVGVAADSKYAGVTEAPRPYFYAPFQQMFASGHDNYFYVRASGSPAGALEALRRAIGAIDGAAGLYRAQPLTESIRAALYGRFIAATLVSALGALAMLLAAMGLYSVMAYAVSERRQEIGIRMALGAKPADVLASVLCRAMTLAGAGVLVGTAAALACLQLVSGMLVGISPTDPAALGGAGLLLGVVALAAAYAPARRATRIAPIAALRTP
ncbi:MAG: ABC transporter permease [Bryobacteraceae bacterium]|nr:ABC transporter permease [Bryobacteraceae bacterium]